MTDKAALTLHRKLAQVMHEVGRIPKNGKAPQAMGGYSFVQVGDAADAIRAALAEKLITMIPTHVQVVGQVDRPTKSGGTMTTVDLIVTWTLTDGESGESIEIQSFGAGADGGDKYSGKASTSAMKYALLTGFLLSTGEDSELGTAEAGQRQSPDSQPASSVVHAEGGLIGVASLGTSAPVDGQSRQTPDGMCVGFVIGEGREKVQVVAYGARAEAFAVLLPSEVVGKRVQVFGPVTPETMKVRGRDVTFNRVRAERVVTPDATFEFPAEAPTAALFTGPEFEKPAGTAA